MALCPWLWPGLPLSRRYYFFHSERNETGNIGYTLSDLDEPFGR